MIDRWRPEPLLFWQLLACWSAVLPLLTEMPVWLGLLLVVASYARLQIFHKHWRVPRGWQKALLILLVLAGLLFSFDRSGLMRATVALLIAGVALKMIEAKSDRDALLLLYLSYLLIAVQFLFATGIGAALYALLCVWLVLSAQITLHDRAPRLPLRQLLAESSRLLLPALPLMVILFLIIPRIGPLWTVPLDRAHAQTGLAEEVSPADISALTRSGEVAFRAEFAAAPPPPELRYWRALIYTEFDGRRWKRPPGPVAAQPLEMLTNPDQGYRYSLIMEPSYRPWIAALDLPVSVTGAELSGARQVFRRQPLDRRIQLEINSVARYRLEPSDPETLARNLRTGTANPRTQVLARELWQASAGDPQRFIASLLARFNASFSYTLQPPALGTDSVDQFLFETQRGFCGHFASATALLLRAAGIPARLVGGYLGGQWNPLEGYLTVRQYDAHAWVEYYDPQFGWQRLDPTAAVAPERVEQTAEELFADQPGFLADQPLSPLRFSQSGWLLNLRFQLDALNYAWHRWVLNYQSQQTGLLTRLLGQITPLRIALALLIPAALILLFVSLQLRPKRPRRSRLERALHRYQCQAEKAGLARTRGEPVYRHARSAAQRWPEHAELFAALEAADLDYRYRANRRKEARERLVYSLGLCANQLQKIAR